MENYNVQDEARKVFIDGIVHNPLMRSQIPPELESVASNITFTGATKPSIPINWRFAESISALKAFEAAMLSILIARKYGVSPGTVTINTDHASLFIMSCFITQLIGENGRPQSIWASPNAEAIFPNEDNHEMNSPYRIAATNIYKTKDGKYYHIHGGLIAEQTLTALGMAPNDASITDRDAAVRQFQSVVGNFNATDLDTIMNDQARQAGTVAFSSAEYFSSAHGLANSAAGLYAVAQAPAPASDHPPSWWPEQPSTPSSPACPLAGLRVLDLTRVIAGPATTRSLAEMGASVMRVTGPRGVVPDLAAGVHADLNWGKWNCALDLRTAEGKRRLAALVRGADVVVDGYRPGVMERLGFGRQDVFNLVKGRGYGVVHVRENCYGWEGPWARRSGWQQISDACCGVSLEYGQAMGLDEPVTPVFPNSDYCTGTAGCIGVLQALVGRAEKGGSYGVDVALNYYSQWLVRSVGTYPPAVWSELWSRYESPVFHHYQNMHYLLPAVLGLLRSHDATSPLRPEFFEPRYSKFLRATIVAVKPVAQFDGGVVKLGFRVGTRGNGVDDPVWPTDLTVETVKEVIGGTEREKI